MAAVNVFFFFFFFVFFLFFFNVPETLYYIDKILLITHIQIYDNVTHHIQVVRLRHIIFYKINQILLLLNMNEKINCYDHCQVYNKCIYLYILPYTLMDILGRLFLEID